MKDETITAAIAIVFGFVGGLIPAGLDYFAREHETSVKMIEIAVGLLGQAPGGPLQPARQWAVQVIKDNSKTPLGEDAQRALSNCRFILRLPVTVGLDPNDKFGDIAAKAMEKAQGLEGDCLK